jgi:hypothetical protein
MSVLSKKIIEFVVVSINETESGVIKIPFVSGIDVNDISRIIQHDKNHCNLITKDGTNYIICGTYRTLSNRWIYTLEKTSRLYDDEIIRPSIKIFHDPDSLGVDSVHFDSYQLLQFMDALRPEIVEKYRKKFLFMTSSS